MHRRDLGIQGAGRENDLDRRALLRVLSPPQYLSIGSADDGVPRSSVRFGRGRKTRLRSLSSRSPPPAGTRGRRYESL